MDKEIIIPNKKTSDVYKLLKFKYEKSLFL